MGVADLGGKEFKTWHWYLSPPNWTSFNCKLSYRMSECTPKAHKSDIVKTSV